MSEIAIRADGLGKRYRIGALQERERTLGETLKDGLTAPFERTLKLMRGEATGAADLDETIWALRDVNFEVEVGEVLGIIGANGAGKSTLLKILSRITEPTEGYVELRGRVGSLLEVGTGFHKELTGRENVFLNGAVLGMGRAEIEDKFDEIVEFAGTGRFIDTPVKFYSSGMRVRLAFAVAAHLDPEILVVDEVLSVGDAAFRQKCLGKMGEVAGSGRTVVFVSHNMAQITDLCERVILLEDGEMTMDGPADEVVSHYLSESTSSSGMWERSLDGAEEPEDEVFVHSIRVTSKSGELQEVVRFDRPFFVEIRYDVREPVRNLDVLFGVENQSGNLLWTSYDTDTTGLSGEVREPGRYVSRCKVPAGLLRPGTYWLNFCAQIPGIRTVDGQTRVVSFDISNAGFGSHSRRPGAFTPMLDWEVRREEADRVEIG